MMAKRKKPARIVRIIAIGREMDQREYRRVLAKLDIGVLKAGRVLGVSRRQTLRYANGESIIPDPVAKLLRASIVHKLTADDIAKL